MKKVLESDFPIIKRSVQNNFLRFLDDIPAKPGYTNFQDTNSTLQK